MTDSIVLDTTIHEPSATAGEVEMLFFALDRVRAQFAWKVGGLDAAGLRKPHPPSTMTLGGLIKHLALVEDYYVANLPSGQQIGPHPDSAWQTAADDSPEELYALWRDAVKRSKAAWARVLAGGGLDQPSKFTTPSGEPVNIRRVLIDTIEEYLRHTGHADLLREAVDGLVGNDPPQP